MRHHYTTSDTWDREAEDRASLEAFRASPKRTSLRLWLASTAWTTPNPDQSRPGPVSGEIEGAP